MIDAQDAKGVHEAGRDVAMLVGRSAELERLDSVIAGLGQGGAPAVVDIAGEAGIGKSRLLSELCSRARRSGLTVLRGRATEYEQHTAYQTFADAFADVDPGLLDADPALAEAAPVLFGARGAAPSAGTPNRFGLHRAIAGLLARLGDGGLVMALDDLHWADPASLELLDHLIRHPVRGRVLLAVARRDRQTPTSLTSALTRGADSGAVLGMALEPLAEQESVKALASDLPPDHAKELYVASEGNPLYLLSLLHAYRHGASLRGITAPGSRDSRRDSDAIGVPSGLAALLLDELTTLPEPQRRVVEAVAVLGDHATPAMLTLSTGHSTSELDDCTRDLAQRDLLRIGSGDRWALRHPLLRALVYENTAARRRTELHRRAADELARTGASVAERAHHVERSLTGWDPEAAAVLSEAAAQLAHTAPATAAHLLEVVLRLLPDTAEHAKWRGELMLSRARALGVCGDLRESRSLLHALISTSGADDPSLRANAIAQCAVMERHLGHSPEATALLHRELSRRPGPPPGQVVSLGLALGMSALVTVSYPDVRADVARTLAVARSHGDHTGEACALALASLGEAYEGRTEAAGSFADAAARLTDGLTDPNLTELCESLVWLAWAEALLERHGDAERHVERGLDIARGSGQLYVLPHLLTSRAFVHLNTCRLPSALESAEEAESVARAIGSSELLAFTLAFKSLILLLACPWGDPKALATAEEAVATVGSSDSWWASLAWSMLGHCTYVSGDPQRAQDAILHAGAGHELRRVQPSIRPAQLETLVGTAMATGRLDQAGRWAAQAVEEADRLGLRGQRAAALRAMAALAEHRGDTGEAARLFDEAAQEYARSGMTLWEAYSLLRAAPLVKAAGEGSRAVDMWHRAHRLADGGGARLLSDLAEMIRPQVLESARRVPAQPAGLTARELEVAELVAEGLSNQAIATKLYLSRRTVETHLSAIYRKTAVPSRSALASLMTRTALEGLA
ncbi:AAA family ATPase [Streptomyces sp. NPDC057445]|uniref:helix-turn-helix transcriptional regulator n=1 Tax=Streptomyces sp. NPDC057445 TaxID=3346136 RepID=UPI0036BD2CE7